MGSIYAEEAKKTKVIDFIKEVLPRQISQHDATEMVGEHVRWFCEKCRRWRTSEIQPDGGVVCPKCGVGPDWKKHTPTLAYKSRYKRVASLCAEGSDFRRSCIEAEERYCNFIEQTYTGLPVRTKDMGWRYFANVWRAIDGVADYLLSAQDAPTTNIAHAYSEQGLQRRYYDPRRTCNVSSFTNQNLQPVSDDGGVQYTEQEMTEMLSYRAGFATPFYDQAPIMDELLCGIPAGLEREIAHDFARGLTKRAVERKYQLSESKVRTIVRHIAKRLRNM